MVHDGLTNPFSGKQMFVEATEVGGELEITRADLDRWALRSHELALKAADEGRLPEEIVPVTVKGRKGDTVVEVDEGPRRDTSLERLAALPGLVGKEGSHTAGNSPGVNDGGGALVLASEEWAAANGKEALAEIVAHAQSATDFAYLAKTPATAAQKALEKAGLQPGDIDVWEINEAFASVTLNSMRMLGIEEDRVNVNGGAVALGHPIGASGARIIGSLVLELRRRGGGLGCAAICSGGGQGDALIVRSDLSAMSGPPRRGVLRPRQDADGRLLGDLLRARRVRGRNDHTRTARRRPLPESSLPPARLDRQLGRRRTRARRGDARRRTRSRFAAHVPARPRRRAPAALPADARARLPPSGRRATRLHRHGRLAGDGRSTRHVLAFDGGVGSRLEVVDGRYTGRADRAVQLPRRQGRLAARARRRASTSSSPPPTPTRTPSPICRCCAPSGTPSSSIPTPSYSGSPSAKTGRYCASTVSGDA